MSSLSTTLYDWTLGMVLPSSKKELPETKESKLRSKLLKIAESDEQLKEYSWFISSRSDEQIAFYHSQFRKECPELKDIEHAEKLFIQVVSSSFESFMGVIPKLSKTTKEEIYNFVKELKDS